jgi:hypothetical protein
VDRARSPATTVARRRRAPAQAAPLTPRKRRHIDTGFRVGLQVWHSGGPSPDYS